MVIRVPALLDEERLAKIEGVLKKAVYGDGGATAGPAAKAVKTNLQLDTAKTPEAEQIARTILGAFWANGTVRSGALPRRILPPRIARYEPGMAYGVHVDNPVMVEGTLALRTDVSATVFLSDPKDYAGGELILRLESGETRIKLPKGDAILYPTGALHAVAPVTEGVRMVAVTWIQSIVADPFKRNLVYELDLVTRSIAQKMPDSDEARVLTRTYGNLVRLWGEV